MFFFKRRKKEKTLENKFDELNEGILNEKDRENPHKVEHYVIERLEQMIETTKEIEDEKAEYKVVTSYLNDIQTLEGLTEEEKKPITDIASNIVALNKTRYELMHSEKKIADVQFAQMQQEESDIPNAIKRLQSNEAYLETIRRDMKYLEREKGEWQLYQEILSHDRVKMQKFMYVAAGLSVTAALILLIAQIILGTDMRLIWMILIFIAVLGICLPYLKMMNDRTESRRAKANADKAITLLNKVKIKYVNMTNAVDYACEKYHVRNAKELEFLYGQYQEEAREKDTFRKTSDDLDYYTQNLLQYLTRLRMYDTRVWLTHANALVDSREMVELKHELLTRRQKLRARMEYSVGSIHEMKGEALKNMSKLGNNAYQLEQIIRKIEAMNPVFK